MTEEYEDDINLDASIHLLPGHGVIIDTAGFVDEYNALAVRYDTTLNLWYLDRTSRTWHRIPEAEGELLYGSQQH